MGEKLAASFGLLGAWWC